MVRCTGLAHVHTHTHSASMHICNIKQMRPWLLLPAFSTPSLFASVRTCLGIIEIYMCAPRLPALSRQSLMVQTANIANGFIYRERIASHRRRGPIPCSFGGGGDGDRPHISAAPAPGTRIMYARTPSQILSNSLRAAHGSAPNWQH